MNKQRWRLTRSIAWNVARCEAALVASALITSALITSALITSVLIAPAMAAEPSFQAGFAKIDITPERPMPMWGYGARHSLLSQGTRDALFAKVLVLEAGKTRVAIVGLDLGRSLGEPQLGRIRAAIRESSRVEHVLMSGSHTHHGPVLELKDAPGKGQGKYDDAVAYVGQLERKLIAVIDEAAGNLRPARIGWSSRDVDMNRNRHSKLEPKPRDTELAVIRVDDIEGRPLAIVVNFAAHPTILDGSDLRWSAEYPGVMARHVESAMDVACIFMQGAAGDMSSQTVASDSPPDDDPRLRDGELNPERLALLKRVLKVGDEEARKIERNCVASGLRMESFGKRLGERVVELSSATSTRVPEYPSGQGVLETMEFESRVDFKNDAIRGLFGVAFFPELANAAVDDYGDNVVRATLTTVLLNGELALVGGSGEFFSQHAVRLKQRSYATKTLFFGYCNGHNMYFPTIEGAAQGGYGADAQVSFVEVGGAERMLDKALINIFTMQGKLVKP